MAKGNRGGNNPNSGGGPKAGSGNRDSTNNNSSKGRNNKKNAHANREHAKDDHNNHVNDVEHTASKADETKHVKERPQPTSEQLMMARMIEQTGTGAEESSKQKEKIKVVMDFTGRSEEDVYTALFDAGWDQSRAIEILLEGGNSGEWEETGKKKKKKQQADENKDDWDDDYQDRGGRSGRNGPPRMRRGGNADAGNRRGGHRGGERGDRDEHHFDGPGAGRGRRGDPPRRGGGVGRGGGRGGRNFASNGERAPGNRGGEERPQPTGPAAENKGSIDTWSPMGAGTAAVGRGGGAGAGERQPGRPRGAPGQGSDKDAFDNAGNWGDDFPQTEDWDNEEYTGSLADTKVFAPSGAQGGRGRGRGGGPGGAGRGKMPSAVGQRNYSSAAQMDSSAAQSNSATPSASVVNAAGNGSNAASSAIAAAPGAVSVSTLGGVTSSSSYSQPIDLTTLLQKPTTQSSINSSNGQQSSLLQFQQASDSLKGIGVNPGQGSTPTASANAGQPGYPNYQGQSNYAATAAPGYSSAVTGGNSSAYKSGSGAANGDLSRSQAQDKGQGQRSRIPPPSKIPNSAVEMPGESLGRLDVQFGGLDLQFGVGGNSSSAAAQSDNSAGASSSAANAASSGFEFNGSTLTTDDQSTNKYSNAAPSLGGKDVSKDHHYSNSKDVNKGLGASTAPSNSGSSSNSYAANARSGAADSLKSSDNLHGNYSSTNNYNSYNSSNKGYDSGYNRSSNSYNSSSSNNYGSNNSYTNGSNSYQQQSSYSSSNRNSGSDFYNNSSSSNYNKGSSNSASNNSSSQFNQQSSSTNDKFGSSAATDNSSSSQQVSSAALGLTTTTNALSSKVSATSASKVSIPATNIPPNMTNMMAPQQYLMSTNQQLYYNHLQPTPVFSAYGANIDDMAALQRSALQTLPSTYYDATNQFSASSLAATTSSNTRSDTLGSVGATAGSSVNSSNSVTAGSSLTSGFGSTGDSSKGFGSTAADSSSSVPAVSQTQQHQQASAAVLAGQQQTQTQQQASFNLQNVFAQPQGQAATAVPPGYAYFYNQGIPGLAQYGASQVYPAAMAVGVPPAQGGTNNSQFQQKTYGSSNYSYDALGQGNKDFGSNYSNTGNGQKTGNNAGGNNNGGKGHQYWGTSQLTSTQLW